jgi:hypothetical protein
MIPLYGFLEGDTVGLLVLGREEQTIAELAEALQRAAAVRVAPSAGMRLVHRGRMLEPTLTVGLAGMAPLDRFDVVRGK